MVCGMFGAVHSPSVSRSPWRYNLHPMASATIHPSAILEGDIRLGDDVSIGPRCVLTATDGTSITIGAGTKLIGNAYLNGPLMVGERNTIYPFVTLGMAPQDLKWDPNVPGAGLVIGNDNTFRESTTINRATSHETPTRIGNNNYWMINSHAGHDCIIGNNCIFANGTALAGFVRIDDRVNMGGYAAIHQFCRVGRGAMISGMMGISMDLPPFFMLTGPNIAGSINLIGLRRSGMPTEDIDIVKWVYRTLYRDGISIAKATETLREREDHPLVVEYIEFIEGSKRGICPAHGKAIRGTA
jgi:UDP-N-acetylglucosamine acyltransferase